MLDIADLVEKGLITEPDSAKGRLIKVAAQLFREKGFGRTTVRDLAAEVGILSGSLFHHFPNKEAILRTAVEESIHRVIAEMKASMEGVDDLRDKLRVLIHCELASVHGADNPGFQLLVPEWRSLSVSSQAGILELRDVYEGLWREVLDGLRDKGLMAVESSFVRHFMRGALIETHNWFQADGQLTLKDLEEKLIKVVIHDY
jgi:AcrR family transcriptional regulator